MLRKLVVTSVIVSALCASCASTVKMSAPSQEQKPEITEIVDNTLRTVRFAQVMKEKSITVDLFVTEEEMNRIAQILISFDKNLRITKCKDALVINW